MRGANSYRSIKTGVLECILLSPPSSLHLLFLTLLTVCYINADVRTVRYVFTKNLAVKYLWSNGTFQEGSIKNELRGCKPGPGFVFIWNEERDACNNDHDIHVARGSASQWHTDSSRTLKVDAKLTLIQKTVADSVPTSRRIAFFLALTKGGFGDKNHVTSSGVGSVTGTTFDTKLWRFQIEQSTKLTTTDSDGWFCSTTTNGCSKGTFQSGLQAEEVYYSTGNGVEGIYIGGAISYGRYITDARTNNHFFPQATTNIVPIIVGILTKHYLAAGFVSKQWETASAIDANNNSRRKRFAGYAALATAISALTLAVLNKKASKAGFRVSDANDREQESALNAIEENLKILSEIMVQTTLSDYEQNKLAYTLNAVNGYFDFMIKTLTDSAQHIQDFQMYSNSFLVTRTTTDEESKNTALTAIETAHPGYKILSYEQRPVMLIATIFKGNILTTNVAETEYKCFEDTCYVKGKWTKWETVIAGRRLFKATEDPIMTTATCGIYFQALSSVQEATIVAYPTFDAVLNYLTSNGLKYIYVNRIRCASSTVDPTGHTVWTLESRLKDLGYGEIKRISEKKFSIDCVGNQTKINEEDPQGYVNNSILCRAQSDMSDLKRFSDELTVTKFKKRSALSAYEEQMSALKALDAIEGGLEAVGKGAVKIAGVGGDIWNALEDGSLITKTKLGVAAFAIALLTFITVVAVFLVVCCKNARSESIATEKREMGFTNS